MKAVIYARYSSDNQREESIEGQIRECTEFAEKNGMTVLRSYIDRAFSAKTDNRPEFQNMIKDSGKKLFDVVLVWKLDRFARNRYDSAKYKSVLKKNGVKVVSATEVISDGAEGIILESVLEGYAEYYSADLSEKVVRGMTENLLKSKFNGGTIPFGYVVEDQHLKINPLTAPFVLKAFEMYNEGATMKEIRDWMNEHQLKNPRGNPMTYNTVEHMLKNRRYIGEEKFRDMVIPDALPSIVPMKLFMQVQDKIAINKKAPARRKAEDDYLLTTKLFCGYCGKFMIGESGKSRNGNVHRYYKCSTIKNLKGDCKKKSVKKDWIEDLIVRKTVAMLNNDEVIDDIVKKLLALQEKDSSELPYYERELAETEKAIDNLLNAIQQGILTKSTKERLEELEKRKEKLEILIAEEKMMKPKLSEEFIRFYLGKFRKLDMAKPAHRKMLIETFVNSVYIFDDKIVITYNADEKTETVTLEEINGSIIECLGAPTKGTIRLDGSFCLLRNHNSNL